MPVLELSQGGEFHAEYLLRKNQGQETVYRSKNPDGHTGKSYHILQSGPKLLEPFRTPSKILLVRIQADTLSFRLTLTSRQRSISVAPCRLGKQFPEWGRPRFVNAFYPGTGWLDIQTHYNGTIGQNVPAFRDAASYLYGVAGRAAEFPLETLKWAGGKVNLWQHSRRNVKDVSGEDSNSPENVRSMTDGYQAQQNRIFGQNQLAPPSSLGDAETAQALAPRAGVPPSPRAPSDDSNSFGNRLVSLAGIDPLNSARPVPRQDRDLLKYYSVDPAEWRIDRPSNGPSDNIFDTRLGNWDATPAGGSGDANSPLLRALEKYRRSAAPDGPSSIAGAPSLLPSNVSEPGFGSKGADELYAARNRAARLLGGAGGYVGDSLIPSAQAASLSPPLYGSSTTDADGSPPPLPIRRLVGRIVDDPRTSAFDSGAPTAPSNGFPVSDRGGSFDDRFGNWASTGAGDTPQQSQDSAPSYSEMLHQYLNQPAAGQSQAPASAPGIDALNPYQSAPPTVAPPVYSTPTGNGAIEKWIASLAGVDPDDPTQFQVPPIFSPLYRR